MVGFENHCKDVIDQLRAALIELYSDVGADPLGPQQVSRRFGLNKTLTWSLSRVMQEADALAALRHVPGEQAIGKLLTATAQGGAGEDAIERVRAAVRRYDELVDLHVGDRPTLELVIDSFGEGTDALERSRKMAFRGNSGIFGVQAKCRLAVGLLTPSKDDPGRLDMAMLMGYSGFRRLRDTVRWPLFKLRAWDADEALTGRRWQSVSGDSDRDELNLMREFCTDPLPDISLAQTSDGSDCILEPGPLGNPGAFSCFRGDLMRSAVPRFATPSDASGEFGAAITTPSEHLIFDIVVHKDLEFALKPELVVYARAFAHRERTDDGDPAWLLPISTPVVELSGHPPVVSTPLVPGYSDMIHRAQERLGHAPDEFRAIRAHMKYPPLGATVLLRFALPEAPE